MDAMGSMTKLTPEMVRRAFERSGYLNMVFTTVEFQRFDHSDEHGYLVYKGTYHNMNEGGISTMYIYIGVTPDGQLTAEV